REDEPDRLKNDLTDRVNKSGSTLGCVMDLSGKLITSTINSGVNGDILHHSIALTKIRENNKQTATIEHLNGKIYFVTAAPLQRYGEQTLGYVAIANVFDPPLLQQLKEASNAEIVIIKGGTPIISTVTVTKGLELLTDLELRFKSDAIVPVDGLVSKGGSMLAAAMPLGAFGKAQAALVFALSAKDVADL